MDVIDNKSRDGYYRLDLSDGKFTEIIAPSPDEVARTAPYMHDGSMATIEDVIDFYSEGGRSNRYLDTEVRARNFTTDEKRSLVAFLRSLNGN